MFTFNLFINSFKFLRNFIFSYIYDPSYEIGNNNIKINYWNNFGKQYFIMLPYSKINSYRMNNIEVFLYSDSEIINITQQYGVPYVFTAKQLNGNYIKAINNNNKIEHNYIDEAPQYLKEVWYNE